MRDRYPPVALASGGFRVIVAEAQGADEYREEHRGNESDAPPQSHGMRRMILAAINEGVFGQVHERSLI